MPDEKINTEDIPEWTDFSNPHIGKFYRPRKKVITIRLDLDVLNWFQSNYPKYQSAINEVLRKHVLKQKK